MVNAMKLIESTLSSGTDNVNIRSFGTNDIETIIKRHMELYAQEYGFDSTFESYVGDAVHKFIESYNKDTENIWVAELNGSTAGFIATVKVDDTTAQLRWFLIEPQARGRGLGKKLMQTVVDFCREKGYKQILLWTISNLETARHLYKLFGFTLTQTNEHDIWGKHLVEERWDLYL